MILRPVHGWQLILADLSLILFLVTLTALVNSSSDEERRDATRPTGDPQVAPAQALFRHVEGGPDLREWINEQTADPRATLTIIAQHTDADRERVWRDARGLAQSVKDTGVPVRVVITKGGRNDVYASLAYDAPDLER